MRSYFPEPPDLFNTGYPLAHLWSLNVEEHCYVLLSLLTLWPLLKGREALVLIGLGCLSIGINLLYIYVPEAAPRTGGWIKTEAAMSFLLISAGYALLSERMNAFVKPWMPIAALVLSIVFCLRVTSWMWLCRSILSPFLLAFAVNHLAQTPGFFRNALATTPLRLLGISSYSIYLYQQFFYQYSANFLTHESGLNFLCFLLALSFGGMMFYCFENPSRNYLNKIW
jgi:peptidoglycan/LPS O-acetylase OafA/YrhL